MFHIFRWRRDRRNASTTPLELLSAQENKNAHSRRHRLHVYHGAHSIERLFHVKRHRSPSEHDKHQVIKNEKNIQEEEKKNHIEIILTPTSEDRKKNLKKNNSYDLYDIKTETICYQSLYSYYTI